MSTPSSPYSLSDALEWYDNDSRRERLERIEWASTLYQPSGLVAGSFLPLSLMEEARLCYVNGQFMGALLCATSVAEHLLVEELETLNLARGQATLGPSIKTAKENQVLPTSLCETLERLNNLRNPLAHRRDPQDSSTLTARFRMQRVHPNTLVESDARFALKVMYEVFDHFLKRAI